MRHTSAVDRVLVHGVKLLDSSLLQGTTFKHGYVRSHVSWREREMKHSL